MGGARSLNPQGSMNGVSQVDREHRLGSHLCLPDGCGEGSTEEQWHLPVLPAQERAASSPHCGVSAFDSSLCVSGASLAAASGCTSEQGRLCAHGSVHGSFQRRASVSSSPLSLSFSHAIQPGGIRAPPAGSRVWGRNLLFPQGEPPKLNDFSQFVIATPACRMGLCHSAPLPSCHVSMASLYRR